MQDRMQFHQYLTLTSLGNFSIGSRIFGHFYQFFNHLSRFDCTVIVGLKNIIIETLK